MEELQEADVLWPDTPPPSWGGRERYLPELYEAGATVVDVDYSFVSFGSELAVAASSSSSASSTSSAPPSGGPGSSDGFLSDVPSTFAGAHGDDDVGASFQEADVLWPDDGYAARPEREVDGGELWWLCCGLGADYAARARAAEPAAVGAKRGATWRSHFVSSPIDIPTGAANANAAARRRRAVDRHGSSAARW